MWLDHAERDRRNPQLLGKDARYHTYDELLATADPALRAELEPGVWDDKYRRCQEAIEALTADLAKARADIAIVVGDDQRELFRDDGIPAFACFTGTELVDMPPAGEALQRMPKGIRAASWAAHSDHEQAHPVQADLSAHIAVRLAADDFDLTVVRQQPAGRSLGHAFTFPRYRLGLPSSTPVVPIFVNTYYPPNVPSAARCLALGRALRAAVESWDPTGSLADTAPRVAVIASGGLSHFVVDEDLDHAVLNAITARDGRVLGSLTRDQMRSGTSEILNWVVAAGALENLPATILDYVPGYRTPAGTGAGMAFVRWE
jgi:catalytic LigB subunit of aromatic ring-opening dioxygenase